MTTPPPPEQQLRELEEATAEAASAAVDAALIAYGLTVAAIGVATAEVIGIIREGITDAVKLGIRLAAASLSPRRRPRLPASRRPVRSALRIDVEGSVRDAMSSAAVGMARASTDEERRVEGERAKTLAGQTAATLVNEAAAAGSEAAAVRAGAEGLVWVAERDACLTCLALQGRTVKLGERFPAGVTFGDRPLRWRSYTGRPPRHPNCRCRVQPWFGESSVVGSLLREARRSVVRGFSRPSESNAARLRAARRLLAGGAGLPRSVEEYGARSVRLGRFPRGRAFPTGRRPAA